MKKKILSSLIIGAFVFGLGAADMQPASAAYALAKERIDRTKEKSESNSERRELPKYSNDDKSDHPEPPKDSNGNPIAPPDRNNGDKSDRPTPPDKK